MAGSFAAEISARAREQGAIPTLPCQVLGVATNYDFHALGETRNHVCLVAEGLVGSFAQTMDGRRQIFALHIPGDVADLYSLVEQQPITGLQALTDTRIISIHHAALQTLLRRYPQIARALWRDCVVEASILSTWMLNLGCRTGAARLAHLFCELAIRSALVGRASAMCFELPARQHHLAECTGMTLVHLNRMLIDLRRRGLLRTWSRMVQILDWRALVEIAEFDANYLQLPATTLAQAFHALNHPADPAAGDKM